MAPYKYGNLIYWGAAKGYLEKLDRVQSSAVSILEDSAFFILSLERWPHLQAA